MENLITTDYNVFILCKTCTLLKHCTVIGAIRKQALRKVHTSDLDTFDSQNQEFTGDFLPICTVSGAIAGFEPSLSLWSRMERNEKSDGPRMPEPIQHPRAHSIPMEAAFCCMRQV